MAFCAMAINYLKFLYMAVMAALGIATEASIMHLVYTVIGLLGIVIYLYSGILKFRMTKNEVYLLLFIVFFFGLFMFTGPNRFGYTNEVFKSMYLTFGSASIPAFLLGVLMRKKDNIKELGKWIPVFIILMTISCFLVALNPSTKTTGGYLRDESGFSYQTLSYTAAYVFGLTMYYVKYYEKLPKFYVFTDPLWKKIFVFFMILQLLTVFLAGGRGGFLVIAVFAVYYLFLTSKNFLSFIIKAVAIILVAVFVLTFAQSLGIESAGYDRILTSITTGNEGSERALLRNTAIAYGKQKPILGQGVGCVFYVMDWYSHNLFTDVFCEMGLVGLGVLALILLFFMIKIIKLIIKDPLNHIVLIMFLSGFIMLMFSNYYAAVPFVWFACGYTFLNDTPRKEKHKNEIHLS